MTLGTPLPPALGTVQEFYDSFCARHFGPRRLEDSKFVWDDACVFVARTAEHDAQIWLLLGGPGLDVVQLDCNQNLSHIPAPAGRVWFPGEVQGNTGIAFLQSIDNTAVCPAPTRLSALQIQAPDGPADSSSLQPPSPTHSVRSIFGTSSSGNFTPVEDVEEAIAALLAVQDVLVEDSSSSADPQEAAGDAATGSNGAGPGTNNPTTSDSSSSGSQRSSSTEGAALLQVKMNVRSTLRPLPTPCRAFSTNSGLDDGLHQTDSARAAAEAAVLSTRPRNCFCIELWTDTGFYAVPCPEDATHCQVCETLSERIGILVAPDSIVPLFPQPESATSFVCLLKHSVPGLTTVLVQPPQGRSPFVCHLGGRVAAADVCASAALQWSSMERRHRWTLPWHASAHPPSRHTPSPWPLFLYLCSFNVGSYPCTLETKCLL